MRVRRTRGVAISLRVVWWCVVYIVFDVVVYGVVDVFVECDVGVLWGVWGLYVVED